MSDALAALATGLSAALLPVKDGLLTLIEAGEAAGVSAPEALDSTERRQALEAMHTRLDTVSDLLLGLSVHAMRQPATRPAATPPTASALQVGHQITGADGQAYQVVEVDGRMELVRASALQVGERPEREPHPF